MIVARERVEPLLRLPPLRVETALMLAAEKGDELGQSYENIGYDYFAGLSNPDLARVVQYTALYQIFRKFGITIVEPTIEGSLVPGNQVLELKAFLLLTKLQAIPPDKLSSMVDENVQISDQEVQSQIKKSIEQLHQEINYGKNRWENLAIPELSRRLASPRTYTPSFRDSDFDNWLSSIDELISTDINLRQVLFILLNVNLEEVTDWES